MHDYTTNIHTIENMARLSPYVGVKGKSLSHMVSTKVYFVPVFRVLQSSQSYKPSHRYYRLTRLTLGPTISARRSRLSVVSRVDQFKIDS
jgi:hypothetical protein